MSQNFQAFQYKISLGQNFIFDEALLHRLVDQTPLGQNDTVLEIGAGRGDLTLVLAARAKQVITVEIDSRLEKVLLDRFSEKENIRLVMGDIMKLDLPDLMAPYQSFHVVANLPYYLTTPILDLLFRSTLPILSVSVMVQKEAAQRVLAQAGTPEYGPLAIMAHYRGIPRETMLVPAKSFTPPPKVDSVFLVIPFHGQDDIVHPPDRLEKVVNAAFAMRRKTLVNNLMKAFSLPKEQAISIVYSLGLDEKVRGETLSLQQFIALTAELIKITIL